MFIDVPPAPLVAFNVGHGKMNKEPHLANF
jgi:hypothetical protein